MWRRTSMSGAQAPLMNARRDTRATASAKENASESRRFSVGSKLSRDCARPGIEARIELDGCSPLRQRLTIWCGSETWRKLPPEASQCGQRRVRAPQSDTKSLIKYQRGQGDQSASLVFPQPASAAKNPPTRKATIAAATALLAGSGGRRPLMVQL